MPDQNDLVSLSGAEANAIAGRARLANSVLHLFRSSFTPTPTSVLANFLAAECDFDGYSPLPIVAWSVPILAGAAWVTYAPTQTFLWVFDSLGTGNQVGGSFLVLSGGGLDTFTLFDPTRPCSGPGQAIVTTPTHVFPAG